MKKDDTVTLSVNHVLAHAMRPMPAAIEQREAQFVIWETESYLVDSAYTSEVERVKIR
jgi:oligosaccharyltransferase complex subunit alpha (ribophorin I)